MPGELKRRLKTGAPNSARQEAGTAPQPRRKGFYARGIVSWELDIYTPLPPTSQPGQDRTGPADGDQARPATPDHKTAPAQDSTHTRTGANQNRARGRRYSLDNTRRLRVRERRIFLGVGEFFPLPSAGREKVRGSPKIRGKKSGAVCEQIMNFREVAHCVPVFVIN